MAIYCEFYDDCHLVEEYKKDITKFGCQGKSDYISKWTEECPHIRGKERKSITEFEYLMRKKIRENEK